MTIIYTAKAPRQYMMVLKLMVIQNNLTDMTTAHLTSR